MYYCQRVIMLLLLNVQSTVKGTSYSRKCCFHMNVYDIRGAVFHSLRVYALKRVNCVVLSARFGFSCRNTRHELALMPH